MKFLADESCDFRLVHALRDAGHDVVGVAEISPRADDSEIIGLAVRDQRVLLTEDKDFGQLVFASGMPSSGVILLRYHVTAREAVVKSALDLIHRKGDQLTNCFVVIQPGRIRISKAP